MRIGKLAASAVLTGALMLGLSGCGSSSSDSGGGPEIQVSLKEFSITPEMIHIPPEGARLVVKNEGTMPHNLQIPDLDIMGNMLAPGETQTITVKSGKKGTVEGLCSVAGHKESGMVTQVMMME